MTSHQRGRTSTHAPPRAGDRRPVFAVAGQGVEREAFVVHLLALHEARQTGVMTVRVDGTISNVYLRDGAPIFAEQNTLAGSLGRALLRDGAIDEGQYEAVIAQMTQEIFESEQMRFAEVAVALGYCTHQQVHVRLEQQVRDTVIACMAHPEPEVDFRPGNDALHHLANYPCPVQALVMQGVKTYYDLARTESVWRPDARAFAELSTSADETAASYALQPNERRYLGNIDGSRRVEELIHTGFLDILHATQIMVALLLTDGVKLYDKKRSERIPVVETESRQATRTSDSARRRMSSPLLRAVRVPEAAGPSSEVPARPQASHREGPVSQSRQRVLAERLFCEGVRQFKADSLRRALDSFARAAALNPEAPEYTLYEKWTEFLLKPSEDAEAALSRLERLALGALKQDKSFAFAHYVCGRVAHARGDTATAKVAFKMALRFDSGQLQAKRFLHALMRR